MNANWHRGIFWTVILVGVVIPAVLGWVRLIRGPVQPAVAAVEKPTLPISTQGAAATAAGFAREYMTFDLADATGTAARQVRLRAYQSSEDGYAGLVPDRETKSQAVWGTWVHGYRSQNEDGTRGAVTVQVLVSTPGQPGRNVYLSVPLAVDGAGRWAVTDLPRFEPAPGVGQVELVVPGEPAEDPEGTIRAMLTGFLKAYTAGTAAEIQVYMSPGATSVKGLAETMSAKLREINELQLYRDPTAGTVHAVVRATLVDPMTGAAYRQAFRIGMTQAGGRWSINTLN